MLPTGIALITAERERQITQEGMTAEHDDKYEAFTLSTAGACYVLGLIEGKYDTLTDTIDYLWPFDGKWWKPTPNDPIRQLVKAGALIAAEIDRLQRLKGKE